ncbi:MAG TPA: GNAT family N-acetyltransferase [Candidatus Limnocylindria bacterium]|nr:GNAT family N-acetyltransferase [Candidatus Limnocylindria bacterium]
MHSEWERGDYRVSTDPKRLDLDVIHGYLATSYWAPDITRGSVEKAIAHSISFGLYCLDHQIGFARVISDRATFAYLADVFVLESHRGRGLAQWMVECALAHPDLGGLRNWLLATRDAHELYRRCGYHPLTHPERWMQRRGVAYDRSSGGTPGADATRPA